MKNKLYPPIVPYNEFYLNVSSLHTIYIEESGNPNGKPVIFLHGGPGGGIEKVYRQYLILNYGELLFSIKEVAVKVFLMQSLKKIILGI